MQFLYPYALLPRDTALLTNINAAAGRLARKLSRLDLLSLDISDYNKRYLGDYLKDLRYHLQRFTYILAWAVADTNCPLHQFVFIDYGGGSGLLSFLAKELGVGAVIYNDIYNVSCRDAGILGRAIEDEPDDCVRGDVDELLHFVKTKALSCNAIASNDVIEHVYDAEGFLRKISDLSDRSDKSDRLDGSFSVVMASDANPFNPRTRRRLMKMQIERELKDREKVWGHKERDSLRAYLGIRKEIISNHAPTLSGDEIERLAKATRGLIESEIRQCVDAYVRTKTISRRPDHPTNTCDPYTGNWAERLMDLGRLSAVLSDRGFAVDILAGHYGSSRNPVKRLAGALLNMLIVVFKKKQLVFAPFYVIYARKPRRLT
jgi:hypothetical protein